MFLTNESHADVSTEYEVYKKTITDPTKEPAGEAAHGAARLRSRAAPPKCDFFGFSPSLSPSILPGSVSGLYPILRTVAVIISFGHFHRLPVIEMVLFYPVLRTESCIVRWNKSIVLRTPCCPGAKSALNYI